VNGVELERTACYACTGWHTCLVFLTDAGVRIPLCEACLRVVVPRAIETGVEAPSDDGTGRAHAAAGAAAGRPRGR
jgi:hypothetical protein